MEAQTLSNFNSNADTYAMLAYRAIPVEKCLVAEGLGVNWGLQATHPLPPDIVSEAAKDNGFNKVKLFEADPGALKALGRSGVQVMVGIPNDLLAPLSASVRAAEQWVQRMFPPLYFKWRRYQVVSSRFALLTITLNPFGAISFVLLHGKS
ncbi:hypothetical protein HAX54_031988 [Datura stramonium]|uniref:Glucan endo-1,3-beta-D-glucosidase n=1 Tax=Datura stramonium TaxID=4076 RepID=A0ABS8SCC2_DATST|nr:hypothetical protein [Datura stramonium]